MLNLKKLKEARERRGLKQVEVAKRISIAQSHYNNIELGKKQPSVHTLSLILQCLGVDIQDVWDVSDGTTPPILPVRNDNIVVEKNVVSLKYNFPNSPETLQYLNQQMQGKDDIDPEFMQVIEGWARVSNEVKIQILELLKESTSE